MSGLDGYGYVPQRFTVGLSQGLTESAMRALATAAEQEGHDDPREMAATLIIEGLERRGLLPRMKNEK